MIFTNFVGVIIIEIYKQNNYIKLSIVVDETQGEWKASIHIQSNFIIKKGTAAYKIWTNCFTTIWFKMNYISSMIIWWFPLIQTNWILNSRIQVCNRKRLSTVTSLIWQGKSTNKHCIVWIELKQHNSMALHVDYYWMCAHSLTHHFHIRGFSTYYLTRFVWALSHNISQNFRTSTDFLQREQPSNSVDWIQPNSHFSISGNENGIVCFLNDHQKQSLSFCQKKDPWRRKVDSSFIPRAIYLKSMAASFGFIWIVDILNFDCIHLMTWSK